MKHSSYTNRQRRNNLMRERCHKFMREMAPLIYAKFRREAEEQFAKMTPQEAGRKGGKKNGC